MRVLVIVKATPASEAGRMPTADFIATMGAYNAELAAAGIMKDGGGLRPTRDAIRVDLKDRTSRPGPFPPEESPMSGYWFWEVKDLSEAEAWALKCPSSPEGPFELELRPLFEAEDYEGAA